MPSFKQHGGKLKDHRPRKQSQPTQSSVDEPNSQQTISDLFASSKQLSKGREVDDLPGASPSKRLKLGHSTTQSSPTAAPVVRMLRADERYNFSTPTSRRTSESIDLTGDSPNVSPLKKKLNLTRPTNITPHTGTRKIPVINLRTTPKVDPDEYYNRVWGQLDAALSAIFAVQTLPYSMEELYKGVEIACRQNRAPALYDKLCERCSGHISGKVKDSLQDTVNVSSDAGTLDAVVQAWMRWGKQLEVVRSIFFYLDRSYLLHTASKPSIEEMGTIEFRKHIFMAEHLQLRILQGACDLVGTDRHSKQDAHSGAVFRDAIKMFHALTVYTKFFEPRLMVDSEQYYLSWANEKVTTVDLAGYVESCDGLILQELSRCDIYGLDQTTKKGLETYLEDILVDQRQKRLLVEEDVGDLLGQDRADTVSQLFSLLQRRRLGEKLRPAFEAFIVKQGSEIVFDEEREQEMVIRLLEFKRKLDQIWAQSFQRHEGLGHSLREAFETFINKSKRSNMTWGTDNPKPGEMIAKYVDMVLKGGTKAIRASGTGAESISKVADNEDQEGSSEDEDAEIGKQLDQVLDLFRFVHGKAVFEAFYKRDLARRLLLGRSASADSEKSMLTRLKSECGAGFTHNLEQMFKDIEMAREEISSYKAMLEERQVRPLFDLSVNVLSASAWPSYPDVVVNVPEHVLKATANFEQHYKIKHTGRRLEWKHALAHCQLKASFPKGAKEIVVSCFQAVILMAFNQKESMSYADLKAASGLDDAELKRTLQSLACARYRVLSKTPKGKEVNVGDSFDVNISFSHPKYRIKINQIQAKETKAENRQTHERVAADRNFETQAAIVRIMKSRKTITHAELVSEVITATKSRGVMDPGEIKKTIEKLIEKDYMERQDDEGPGHNVYSYVA